MPAGTDAANQGGRTSTTHAARGGLIQDVTVAPRNSAVQVAEFELENLKEGRSVYLQRGALFFRSSREEAFRSLTTGGSSPAVPASPQVPAAARAPTPTATKVTPPAHDQISSSRGESRAKRNDACMGLNVME
eukprot:TRINITY_DN67924_c0_g1_i1.p1 TRINITY_DN67924_c0_g1~~TRINITY_DN67924_c0_g1_i1.p1  ORF type:complete len:149 (-),score=17.08 TRINITY_DN67924_c0_g1_i1:82-480(-)